ncbi:MAG: BACON domain-containing protein [Tannerella sp.]|jgi:hypothetical protein|nr:BACON domain-containing protein [Tannerella sp.]
MKSNKKTATGLCGMIFYKSLFKPFISIVMIGLTVMGCVESKELPPIDIYLRMTPKPLDFPFSGGEAQTFSFVTNTYSWNVTSDQSWVSISMDHLPASSPPNSEPVETPVTVSVTVQENPEDTQRSATITVGGVGIRNNVTIPVTMGAPPQLKVEPLTIKFSAAGDQRSLKITSNIAWTVRSEASWLKFSAPSGAGDSTILVTAEAQSAQSQRNATIIVSGSGLEQPIEVSQSAFVPMLVVSPTTLVFPNSFGSNSFGTQSFTVTSNISWKITVNSEASSWLTFSPDSSANNGEVNVTAAANTSTTTRKATLTIKGGNITRTVTVQQSGETERLEITTPPPLSFGNSLEQKVLSIASNINWNVTVSSDAASWLSIDKTTGSNDGTITVTAAANTTPQNRGGTITVRGGSFIRSISVVQFGVASPYIKVDKTSLRMEATHDTQTFTIDSNIEWKIEYDIANTRNWLTVTPLSGIGKTTVEVVVEFNEIAPRTATLTITGGNFKPQTVSITQPRGSF